MTIKWMVGDRASRLLRPGILGFLTLLAGLSSCASPDSPDETIPRTADVDVRGLRAEDFPRVQQLGDGVYVYEHLRPAELGGTTNSLFVVTEGGVVVVDGQGSPDDVRTLMAAIGDVTDTPISHVVIGSDHGDHTGGNEAFPSGVTFVVHPTSAATLGVAETDQATRGASYLFVTDSLTLNVGQRDIQVLHLGRAHTGGDLVVYLPKDRILFMSEVYFYRLFPSMRSAYPSEWLEVIRAAQAMPIDLYVPGHGFVEAPHVLEEELDLYRTAMEVVIDEGRRLFEAGRSVSEAVEEADFGEFGEWAGRDRQVERALARIHAEWNGELPEP